MLAGRALRYRSPVTLLGRRIRLRPLALSDAAALAVAGEDPAVWTFMRTGAATTRSTMEALVGELLQRQASGSDLPFTTIDLRDGRPVGMTRFLNIDRENDCVEVGGTWLDRRLWRSPMNTESKLLMLRYAFETAGAHRVELRTDLRNDRSQRAIERLGAERDGLLREHVRLSDGYRRTSVLYSILEDEWPSVRERLEQLVQRPWVGGPPPRAPVDSNPEAARAG